MQIHNYGINDIESLSFVDGVRKRISMYLGSADMEGVYNAIQEIISNSIDEFYMGYGNKIIIDVTEGTHGPVITIQDFARGVPFGVKPDGSNVLVDIFSRPHTGGKFNNKVYNSVAGLNGIGAKATCLSSLRFAATTVRDGKRAEAGWAKGILTDYKEIDCYPSDKTGTTIQFIPDPEVYNLEPIKIDFKILCERCKNLSYLTKGFTFELYGPNKERITYCAKNGLLDLIKDNSEKAIHTNPIYYNTKVGAIEVEIAMMWTKGREKSYTFTNGLCQTEGGTSLTGVKTATTLFMKKQIGGEGQGDFVRTGLVYAVACKIPNPSFANQTKTKINNAELRTICQQATTKALEEFVIKYPKDFTAITDFLGRERKAELAAENARKKVLEATKEVERNQKRKVFASDKLKDAEFLGDDSILLIVEGDSAMGGMSRARDYKKYGLLAIRGKMINALSNKDEDIYDNEEIKLLLSAMNIIPGAYNSKKLRYGKIGICVDADSDGGHIALLIMAALYKLAPEFIKEGRLCWLRSPLYIITNGKKETYFFTDEEYNKVRHSISGTVTRAKGLGELSDDTAKNSMFTPEYQRLDILSYSTEGLALLEELMGNHPELRKEYIMNNIDFTTIKE